MGTIRIPRRIYIRKVNNEKNLKPRGLSFLAGVVKCCSG